MQTVHYLIVNVDANLVPGCSFDCDLTMICRICAQCDSLPKVNMHWYWSSDIRTVQIIQNIGECGIKSQCPCYKLYRSIKKNSIRNM